MSGSQPRSRPLKVTDEGFTMNELELMEQLLSELRGNLGTLRLRTSRVSNFVYAVIYPTKYVICWLPCIVLIAM